MGNECMSSCCLENNNSNELDFQLIRDHEMTKKEVWNEE